MIDGAPEIAEFAVDLHEHLIQMPMPLRIPAHVRYPLLSDLGSKHRAKPVPPKPDRLMADVDPLLRDRDPGDRGADRRHPHANRRRPRLSWHNAPPDHKFRVYISGERRRVTETIKRELRRRSAVEPVIGHAKAEHRMGRNYLAGTHGDAANAVLAAAGYNLRRLLEWLAFLLSIRSSRATRYPPSARKLVREVDGGRLNPRSLSATIKSVALPLHALWSILAWRDLARVGSG